MGDVRHFDLTFNYIKLNIISSCEVEVCMKTRNEYKGQRKLRQKLGQKWYIPTLKRAISGMDIRNYSQV